MIQERIVLAQIFYGTSLVTVNPTWLNTGDHCAWSGVTCNSDSKKVTALVFEDFGLSGSYPATLNNLSALTALTTDGNVLTGTISNDICSISNIQIDGDETNCPNDVGTSGCCAAVRLTNPSPYLDNFVAVHSGSSNCDSLVGSESNVCTFMKSKANHADIFSAYPDGFPYDAWLEVSGVEEYYITWRPILPITTYYDNAHGPTNLLMSFSSVRNRIDPFLRECFTPHHWHRTTPTGSIQQTTVPGME